MYCTKNVLLGDRDVHGQLSNVLMGNEGVEGRAPPGFIRSAFCQNTGLIVSVGLELWQKTDVSVSGGQSQWLKATAKREHYALYA